MFRKLLVGTIVLVILLALAATAVVLFVDPNDYREQLSAQASEKLGRPVALNGTLALKVFPRIALEINDVEVGNPPDFPVDEPLAQVGSALASVQLIPLLSGQVLVGDVRLRQVTINLLTVGEKDTNLRGLVAEAANDTAATSQIDLSQIETGAISVDQLTINQRNLLTKESQSVRIDRISIGAFSADQDVAITVNGNILNGDVTLVQDLDIETVINVASDLSRIGLKDISLEAALPRAKATLALTGQGALESLDPITVRFTQFHASAHMEDGTEVDIESPASIVIGEPITLELAQLEASAKLPDGTKVRLSSPLSAQIGTISYLQLAKLHAVADLADGTHAEIDTPINVEIGGEWQRVSMSQLEAKLKVPAQALVLNFKGAVKSSLGKTQTHELGLSEIQLNGQNLYAQGRVELGGQPSMNLKVSGEALDLTPFINNMQSTVNATPAVTPAAGEANGNSGSVASGTSEGMDLSAIRAWQMDLELNLKRLVLPNLALNDVIGVMRARDGLITLDPLSAKLFQGQFRGIASVDTRVNPPAVHLQPRLEGVAVQALLELISPTAPARGTGSMSLDISFSGLDVKQILSSLDGRGEFSVLDGAVIGVDMNRLLNEEMSRSNFSNISQAFGGETIFEKLSGEFNAKSGVLQLPAMDMKTLQFGLTGNGQLDLTQQSLDYDMQLNLGEQLRTQLPKRLVDATGGVIPLKLSGDITAPVVTVNMESLVKNAVEKEAKKQGKKLLNKLFQKLEEKDQEDQGGGGG